MNEDKKTFHTQRRLNRMIVPCDKLSSHFFNLPADFYRQIGDGKIELNCREDKKGEVVTPYWLELVEGYIDLSPLDSFDREVLYACISAYEQGFKGVSIKMSLNAMTGDGNHSREYGEMVEAFRKSIKRLCFTKITVDVAPLLRAYPKYKKRYKGDSTCRISDMLLPARVIEEAVVVNGQEVNFFVEFRGESPIMTVARLKNQLLTYDIAPLDVPKQRKTPTATVISNWLLRRVTAITSGRLDNPSIKLETVYSECGIRNTKWAKQDARQAVEKALNHFVGEGVIESWEWHMENGVYHSITIKFQKTRRNHNKKA